ncbi:MULTISPECIES: hypothetical protein [Cyanophyceae]|uniref:hypothetical protein n=1 Tax=Cyanophyceae TaxID=3028117 RepID=UPI0016869541|nr:MULTISPECIES: hypothetical protein [Cyanophyceae]MBD1918894.1 hypothetical protein [Phormidium sp. FACHB-77]MBD2033264.1 hypothetical protein [Phormidium sp. FACHB-322]MBD2053803.1 hypothetical protein [Leptolyngbya sp. FACHB-60]
MNDKQRQAYERAKSGQGFTVEPKPQSTAEQPAPSGPSHSESKAMAQSTAVAHALRTRLNQDIQQVAGLQDAYSQAVYAAANEASDFAVSGISGEFFWGTVGEMTQQKLNSLPKHEEVTFDVAPALSLLKPPAWKLQGATHNRYLPSATGSFGEYSNPYDDTAA